MHSTTINVYQPGDAPVDEGVRIAMLEPGYATYETEREVLEPFGVGIYPVPKDEDASAAVSKLDPTAIMVRERPVTRELIGLCPNLKVIVRYGVGIDSIDLDAARERGVYVANVPDYGAQHEVSDHAIALYLAVARRIVSRDADTRRGAWGVGQSERIMGHRGATVGLLGFGRIGCAAHRKFRALGFAKSLVCDPTVTDGEVKGEDVKIVELDDLCRQADVVSLHAPLNSSTRHIIDARRIALMKPDAILVNVSRGGLVDEDALAEALHEGRLFGAGIDVFEHEPPSLEHPLFSAPNTVVSDHNAWYSEFSVEELQRKASGEVARVLQGKEPVHWVNRW